MLTALTFLLLTACSPATPAAPDANDHDAAAAQEHGSEDEHGDAMAHGQAAMPHGHVDPPYQYEDLTNPFAANSQAITAGKKVFETNCVPCHGPTGQGDGPAAAALNPKPASLADSAMMMDLSDGYLFWRVNEGGAMEPFNSAMPAWKETLTEEQIWQAITFVHTLSQ
jgi:cytochrome c553